MKSFAKKHCEKKAAKKLRPKLCNLNNKELRLNF